MKAIIWERRARWLGFGLWLVAPMIHGPWADPAKLAASMLLIGTLIASVVNRIRSGRSRRRGNRWNHDEVGGLRQWEERSVVAHAPGSQSGRKFTDDRLFEIGSVSKGLVGIALAELHLRGEVRLGDPVTMYLPDWPAEHGAVTIEDLASHSSKLSRLGPIARRTVIASLLTRDPYRWLSGTVVQHSLRRVELTSPVGTYSNFGFMVLGLALEQATTMPLDQLLKQLIFDPLEMNSTFLLTAKRRSPATVVGRNAHGRPQRNWHFHPSASGAGGYVANSADLGRLAEALVDPQRSELGPAVTLATTRRGQLADGNGIGLGWILTPGTAGEIVWHNGATAGFASFVGANRTTQRCLAVLSSGASPTELTERAKNWLSR